jgi:DeoR/GlpR family transcriptional regulator of sugar metabolism
MRLKDLKVDMCILGTSAINENGISDNDWEVVHVKKAMIESSKKLVCLTISEKLNSQQPLQVCESKRIDTLITELEPSHPLLVPYVHAGIRVM